MLTNPLQLRAFDAVAAALPFTITHDAVTVDDGLSYTQSPIKAHDFAAGVMAVFAVLVERIGVRRGLPAQTMRLDRRLCGLLLNSGQLQFLNGYSTLMDTWPIGPDNGTYRSRDDRYITLIGLHPHLRDGILGYFQCANSARALQTAIAACDAQQIEDDLAELGLPAGIVRTPQQWLAHPQGAAVAARPMLDVTMHRPGGERRLGQARARPLEGLRVVEMAHLVAGPTIGKLLAEQGADVIKVQPPMGDWLVPLWLDTNWGKRSILLDAKGHHGHPRLAELIAGADVLINSNSPGALARMGFDDAALQALNPGLVVANVAYAPAGTPWARRKGFEQIAQSVTGLVHCNSEGLAEPTVISVLINDYMTGYLGAIAVLAALIEREDVGGSWRVAASLQRCSMLATSLLAPRSAERYAPVTLDDMVAFGIDQATPVGVFTRLRPAVEFSHIASMATTPVGFPGNHPDTIDWLPPGAEDGETVPHAPSQVARRGDIRNLVSCYGIVDRGDGGGGFSLASRQLLEYAMAHR